MIKMIMLEDEPWIRKGIEHMLPWRDLGIEYVGFASNGKDGLKLVEKYQPDIILTDIKMPVMCGIQFVEQLRELDYLYPKVIFLTGYNEFTYAKEAIKYGVVDYILKPIDSNELLNTITRLVENIKQEKENTKRINKLQIANYLYEQVMTPVDELEEEVVLPYPYFSFLLSTKKLPKNYFDQNEYINEYFYFQMGHSVIYTLCFNEDVSPLVITNNEFSSLTDEYTFGFSSLYSSKSSNITEAYHEAQYHLQQNLRKESYRGNRPFKRTVLKEEQEKDLLILLQAGDRQVTYEFVVKLLESCLSYEEKLVIHFQLYTFLGRYINKNQILDESNYLYNFKMANCNEDVERLTKEVLFTMIDYIINEWNQTSSEIGKMAKNYIDQYYEDSSLSLSMVADQLKISPSYLSHIFKDELNVNFISYLTEKRVIKAKEKLSETKLPIYTISEKVGFNDPKYFNRVFKRQTGITPKQFREINGGNIAL
ncbi:response regulator [Neobacillus cucumis]|nr:response regulator [Neobacillus cucumis]